MIHKNELLIEWKRWMEMEKLEITLLSGRSIVPLSAVRKSERRGDALEEKINFDLSTLNMKYLVDRMKYL